MAASTDKPRSQEPAVQSHGTAPDIKAPSVATKALSHGNVNFMNIIPESMKPELHYRWVRSRQDESHLQVHRARIAGYDFVKLGEVQLLVEPENRGDGKIYIADTVLMACPKEVHSKRQNQKRQQREATLASTTAVTKQKAKELGVMLIDEEN